MWPLPTKIVILDWRRWQFTLNVFSLIILPHSFCLSTDSCDSLGVSHCVKLAKKNTSASFGNSLQSVVALFVWRPDFHVHWRWKKLQLSSHPGCRCFMGCEWMNGWCLPRLMSSHVRVHTSKSAKIFQNLFLCRCAPPVNLQIPWLVKRVRKWAVDDRRFTRGIWNHLKSSETWLSPLANVELVWLLHKCNSYFKYSCNRL